MTAPVDRPGGTDVRAWLDQLDEARAKGTQGEWHVMRSADDRRAYVITLDRVVTDSAGCSTADAALIVAEHNAFPTLVAELRKRDAALDRVKALLPRIGDLIEFEQDGERDVVALMQVRNTLAAALTPGADTAGATA